MALLQKFFKASIIIPAVCTAGAGVLFWNQRQRDTVTGRALYDELYVRKAIELFMKNGPAVDLVGLPVNFKLIDMNNKFNSIKPLSVQVAIPISGSLLNGEIRVWAVKRVDGEQTSELEKPVEDWELDEALKMTPEDRQKWIIKRFGYRATMGEREAHRRWRVTRVEAQLGPWSDKRFLIFDHEKDAKFNYDEVSTSPNNDDDNRRLQFNKNLTLTQVT